MHVPVLKEEVVHFLNPQENENFVDCTSGSGGHAEALLKKSGPDGKILALEWDKDLYNILKERETQRFIPVNQSYTLLSEIISEKNFYPISGILFDLGFSSYHVDKSKRGFSFMRNEPLDMRYNTENPLTAHEIVNRYKKKDILYILKKWGEEKFAERITEKIISAREKKLIESTLELAAIIEEAIPHHEKKNQKISCSTKSFQAIRIAVNGELLGLRATLPETVKLMKKGGRLVVICFHGGEEAVVRKFFRETDGIKILTPNPIKPKKEEINNNIRSRSAKLYAAIKI